MSEYLSYILSRQREERMSQQLEYQRIVQERLGEQVQEQQLQSQPVLDVSPRPGMDAPTETVLEHEHEHEHELDRGLVRR